MTANRKREWWDSWFIGMAKYVSTASKDPSTQVGAVIVDPNRRIVSMGYNGFARGVNDTEERLNDRETKYKMVQHAEKNAITFAQRDLRRCIIYTYPFMPCAQCAGQIIQAGIVEVIAPKNDNPRWQEDFKLSEQCFCEADVRLLLLDP